MPATRLDVLRLTAGIVIASLVAACSVGAATAPPSVAPAPSPAPALASVAPSRSSAPPAAPSSAPSAAPAPSSTAVSPGGGGRYGPPPTSKPKPTPKPAPTLTIKTGSTSLGTVLVTSDGFTLYFHAGDSSTHSSCTGSCATAWPPLLVQSGTKVKGGSGASGKFATFKRADGTTQVTYNGHPLYSWTGDYSPGDTTGQGIGGFSIAKA